MILIVTNKTDHTSDYLILELQKRQVEYIRFNTEDFPHRVQLIWNVDKTSSDGWFIFPQIQVCLKDITSIWYRRPVPPVPAPEIEDIVSQEFITAESHESLNGLWRCLDCFWISHPDKIRIAEFKLYQLKVAGKLGFQLLPPIITNNVTSALTFYERQNREVVYKPLRRGQIVRDSGVSLIYTNMIDDQGAKRLDMVAYAPSLLQRYIHKQVDIRVTVIGRKAFAVEIHSQDYEKSRDDWRRGDTAELIHEIHSLPSEIESKCINLIEILGLAFGAIDLILTKDGEYVFLEINPNGQWAWIQQLKPEIPLRETLADLLINDGYQNDVKISSNI